MPSETVRFEPAAADAAARLYPRLPLRMWRRIVAQLGMGPSYMLTVDGAAACLVGFVPIAADVAELWLAIPRTSAGLMSRPQVLRHAARACRSILPSHALLARVDDRNLAGQKLALAAGFSPIDEHLGDTLLRSWVRPPQDLVDVAGPQLRRQILQWVGSRER